jgi:uncharacterized membrane protein YuzA (DUF378 family)
VKKVDVVAAGLVIVGALNWGLVGFMNFDLVAFIAGRHFGETTPLSSVIYGLVGLAGLYQAVLWKAIQRRWRGEDPTIRARTSQPIHEGGR